MNPAAKTVPNSTAPARISSRHVTGSEEGLQTRLGTAEDQRMDIMRALIGVHRFRGSAHGA